MFLLASLVQNVWRSVCGVICGKGLSFMSNAQNIILDEPFNAIDPESTSIIKKILFDLKDTGKMILFSVHNLDLVSNFCDKIIFIDNRHSIFECNNPQNFDVLEKIFFDKCVIKK